MNDLNLSKNFINYLLDLQEKVKDNFYLWIELDVFGKCIVLRFDSRTSWHCRFPIQGDLEELTTIEERLYFMYDEYLKSKGNENE